MKAGIANSLSARCAGACLSARTKLRREKRRMAGVGKEHASFSPKKGRKKRKEGAFRKEQGAFLSVMLIAYRESPPTKGSSPLLERVFVVLKITLTRSKNAPNHQINKQKNNRKGGNLKRSSLC